MTIAIILSGCGVYDGSEIHEAVFTMHQIVALGHAYQCFAPDTPILQTINHLDQSPSHDDMRNTRIESARIARGDVMPLSQFTPEAYDAVIFPGGFGVACNLSDFQTKGPGCKVHPDVEACIQSCRAHQRPMGFLCIAPILATRILPGVQVTIGQDEVTAKAIQAMGGRHNPCQVTEITYDATHQVFSSPAYMLAKNIKECAESVQALVQALIKHLDQKS